jgi:predicted mannosyl-3-phosphoglycerate phosphatase (HAD superfamily)
MSRSLRVAGFQVIMGGRFWVITEEHGGCSAGVLARDLLAWDRRATARFEHDSPDWDGGE